MNDSIKIEVKSNIFFELKVKIIPTEKDSTALNLRKIKMSGTYKKWSFLQVQSSDYFRLGNDSIKIKVKSNISFELKVKIIPTEKDSTALNLRKIKMSGTYKKWSFLQVQSSDYFRLGNDSIKIEVKSNIFFENNSKMKLSQLFYWITI